MDENKEENILSKATRKTRRTTTKPYSRKRDVKETLKEETKEKVTRRTKRKEDNETTKRRNTKRENAQENNLNQNNRSLVIRQDMNLKELSSQKDTKKQEGFKFKKPKLKIIPLGGLHEIGKNITIFAYEDEMIVVDCGLSFPDDNMLGVDIVIPDIAYIVRNQEKLKGMVITHGHEDHIGGIPYFLKQVNTPIYGTKLTLGLIKNKLEEHNLENSTKMQEVSPGQTIKLGKYFKVEFIQSSHSIPDSVMFAIHTPVGTVIHF